MRPRLDIVLVFWNEQEVFRLNNFRYYFFNKQKILDNRDSIEILLYFIFNNVYVCIILWI